MPGFRSRGSPAKQMAAEERADRRRLEEHRDAGAIPDAAGEGDPRIRRPYTRREMAEMESIRSARYQGDDPSYHHGIKGARDAWDAAERLGTIAPVLGNPSLDPASGDLVAVSYMCGYGGEAMVGHDACDGVDRYVTGEADANENLRVEGHHGGPPLAMSPDESVMRDDLGFGDMGATVPDGPAGDMDWDLGLRVGSGEGPMSRGWCDWL